jgi:hypothetical protein
MSVKSLRTKANNRASFHQAAIDAEKSPYAKLRRALEWVMAEGRALDRDQIPALTARISGVARELNERSRP